jgi:hypothetical protein
VVVDAVAQVGDLQVADFDIGAAFQVEHAVGAGDAGELGAGLAEDAGAGGGGAAGDGLHVAAVADLVGAGADQQGIATGDAGRPGRGQGDVGVLPGAGLGGAAAGIGSVAAAGALAGIATIGAHVVGRGRLGGRGRGDRRHWGIRRPALQRADVQRGRRGFASARRQAGQRPCRDGQSLRHAASASSMEVAIAM